MLTLISSFSSVVDSALDSWLSSGSVQSPGIDPLAKQNTRYFVSSWKFLLTTTGSRSYYRGCRVAGFNGKHLVNIFIQAHRTPYRLANSGIMPPLRCPSCNDPGLVASLAELGFPTRAVSTYVSLQVATGSHRPLYFNVPNCRRTSRSLFPCLLLIASASLVVPGCVRLL